MAQYKIVKTKADLNNLYEFRKKILKEGFSNADYKDKYDDDKNTINFIACQEDKIYISARFTIKDIKSKASKLPIESFFKIGSINKDNIPVEFSRLMVANNLPDKGMLIKFIIYIFSYAKKKSLNNIYTLANSGTDDKRSVRLLFRIAQIKNIAHPYIKTIPLKNTDNNDAPLVPFFDKKIMNKINKYSRLNYKRLQELEKSGLQLPSNLELFIRLGFKITSIPVFLQSYKRYALSMAIELDKTIISEIEYEFHEEQMLVPKKEINCRNSNAIIQYVKSKNGDINKLLRGIKFSENYLSDENNWVDGKTMMKLLRNARLLLKDKDTAYKIGYSSGQLNSIGLINTLYKLFSTPLRTYKMVSYFLQFWNRMVTAKINILEKNKIEVIQSKGYLTPIKEVCDISIGLLEAIPSIWNLKCDVKEVECVRHGDPHCKFVVTWEPGKSIWQKIYFLTIDKIFTIIKAKRILKQKKELIEKKYFELQQKNKENINLKKVLDRKNKLLQNKINDKIREMDSVFSEKIKKERMTYNHEKNDILDNLTGIITHEIKSNISSLKLLFQKMHSDEIIDENKQSLVQLILYCKKKLKEEVVSKIIDDIEIINDNYKDIDYAVINSNEVVSQTLDLCYLILKNYSQSEYIKQDINSIIKEYYNKYKEKCNRDNIKLKLNIIKNKKFEFNKNHVIVLIDNLISNSLDQLANILKKDKVITMSTYINNNNFIIEINNNGDPISPKDKPNIFKPFYTTSAKKMGLGLSFCMKIIKSCNGNMDFNSNPKKTTFKVYLPLNYDIERTKNETITN